ncbi:MAG: lactonase family protein [bacterium]|nr:lactonase family protein [bacterium]
MRTLRVNEAAHALRSALLFTPLVAATACGPMALGAGVGELASNETQETKVVMLFVNDGDSDVRLRLDGVDVDGRPLKLESDAVPAGGLANLELPRAVSLRVRAVEDSPPGSSPPVTWDFNVPEPTTGTTVNLGVEAGVASGSSATDNGSGEFAIDRLVGDDTAATFQRVAGGEFVSAPDRVALHPGGSYVYTARDLGDGTFEATAYRLDACSGAMELITAEFGSAAVNPRSTAFVGSFAELELFVEPLGRVLYVLQREPSLTLSLITLFPIRFDGSLGEPDGAVRGLVGDLEFRPDGGRVYLSEDLGDGNGFVIRDFALDAGGRIDFNASVASMPCADTERGLFALHPSGRILYTALTTGGQSRIGAYFIGDNGGAFQVDTQCGDIATIIDLEVEASGAVLYVTGDTFTNERRVLRYELDPLSGAFGALADQDLGGVTLLTATDDPARAAQDPLRQIVWIAINDRLVPHTRLVDGSLQALTGSPSLAYDESASADLTNGVRRGCAAVTRR